MRRLFLTSLHPKRNPLWVIPRFKIYFKCLGLNNPWVQGPHHPMLLTWKTIRMLIHPYPWRELLGCHNLRKYLHFLTLLPHLLILCYHPFPILIMLFIIMMLYIITLHLLMYNLAPLILNQVSNLNHLTWSYNIWRQRDILFLILFPSYLLFIGEPKNSYRACLKPLLSCKWTRLFNHHAHNLNQPLWDHLALLIMMMWRKHVCLRNGIKFKSLNNLYKLWIMSPHHKCLR